MNVLFINRYSFRFRGGVEFHILNLGRELIRRGHRVTLLCDSGQEPGDEIWFEGLRVVPVDGFRGLHAFLRQHAREFDLCHAHMSRKLFSMAGLCIAKASGLPTLFTPHCFYPPTGALNRLLKWIYDQTLTRLTFRCADRVVNLTPRDRQDALLRGLDAAKSCIIPNSIALEKLQQVAAGNFRESHHVHADYLLHVGRFQRHKCIDFLVEQQVYLPAFDLVLIGQDDGEMRPIQRRAAELRLGSRVHIFKNLALRDVCSAYRDAAVMVMASRSEGLPTVVLEAMALGVPVVAPAVGGIPFIVQHGETGFLYPWGDGEAYRQCVGDAVRERNRVVAQARLGLEEGFSWRSNAGKILAEYSALLARRASERQTRAAPPCARCSDDGRTTACLR